MLKLRVLSAIVLIPLVALVVVAGGYWFAGVLLLVALLATHEYGALVQLPEQLPIHLAMLLFAALLLADGQWPVLQLARWALIALPLATLAVEVFYGNAPRSLDRWALGLAGALYVGGAAGYFVRLRALDQGIAWLGLALAGTWICDTGAYFVGRAWGRHRLAPQISPKKSWEGVAGGLVSGVLAVALIGNQFIRGFTWGHGLLLGLLLVAASVLGDLAESVIKRQVGAKDSSHLIPGHGGMLDRIDSLLFVVPLVYAFARLAGLA